MNELILIKLAAFLLPFVFSTWLFHTGRSRAGLCLLLLGAFLLRLFMISLDPFLHELDERYHALVARNMMEDPFRPVLQLRPVLPYDYRSWCCNYTWLHKQPLFLWNMSLSIWLFGANEIALRLPSALMGTAMVYFVFSMAKMVFAEARISVFAAVLFALCWYQLELTTGLLTADHNDVAFGFYVTASLWALCCYHKRKSYGWALAIGLLAGCAILCKWLTGGIVYGAWVLLLVAGRAGERHRKGWWHLLTALLLTTAVFLPWQLYIHYRFPLESSWEQNYNTRHVTEVLEGLPARSQLYYIGQLGRHYSWVLVPFLVAGLADSFQQKGDRQLKLALGAVFLVCYLFFSLVPKTKMPSFTFLVAPVGFIAIGRGMAMLYDLAMRWWKGRPLSVYLLLLPMGLFSLSPLQLARERAVEHPGRKARLHNTAVYKSLSDSLAKPDVIVINCKSFENVDLMFYKGINAYHWYPSEKELEEVIGKGYKVYAFQSHGSQVLPDYVTANPGVVIIRKQLR
ncbi:MAG TPA: glycosyltransferase family 39 protein [Flavisolibacter sp.]|nr:glycosyltransferase family 39 protein [Flavisolibacter sp.]